MNYIFTVMTAIVLATFPSCASRTFESLVGGKEGYSLIADLSRVKTCQVYRIDDSYPDGTESAEVRKIQGFSIISGPNTVQDAFKTALSSVLVNPKTYVDYPEPPDCLFRPGVAFPFSDDKNQLDLLICFSCDELKYYQDGKQVGGSHFQPSQLRLLAKKLFPKDKNIQLLKSLSEKSIV